MKMQEDSIKTNEEEEIFSSKNITKNKGKNKKNNINNERLLKRAKLDDAMLAPAGSRPRKKQKIEEQENCRLSIFA